MLKVEFEDNMKDFMENFEENQAEICKTQEEKRNLKEEHSEILDKDKMLLECPKCGQKFADLASFKKHSESHKVKKKYLCEHDGCAKRFSAFSVLKAHQQKHNEESLFKCSYPSCGRSYSRLSRLVIHERTHTGEKPFKCEDCGKCFNEKGNLTTHQRIHTGEKPFSCPFIGCSASFKANGHLRDHMRIHTKVRPFTCDICGKNFSRKSVLKVHRRIHTGDKPFTCPVDGCTRRFNEKSSIKTHVQAHKKQRTRSSKKNGNLEPNRKNSGSTFYNTLNHPDRSKYFSSDSLKFNSPEINYSNREENSPFNSLVQNINTQIKNSKQLKELSKESQPPSEFCYEVYSKMIENVSSICPDNNNNSLQELNDLLKLTKSKENYRLDKTFNIFENFNKLLIDKMKTFINERDRKYKDRINDHIKNSENAIKSFFNKNPILHSKFKDNPNYSNYLNQTDVNFNFNHFQ